MKRIFSFSVLVILFAVILFSCKKENNPLPPEDQPKINLTLEDVSCTEAWIKVSTSNLTFPADVNLYNDSSLIKSIYFTTKDKVLYIDLLRVKYIC